MQIKTDEIRGSTFNLSKQNRLRLRTCGSLSQHISFLMWSKQTINKGFDARTQIKGGSVHRIHGLVHITVPFILLQKSIMSCV